AVGCEKSGPTALLNSVLMLNPVRSWQGGYNVNLRLMPKMLTDPHTRAKVRKMLNSYFERGGQELQINCVDSATLRAAQLCPSDYRDLVVRVAGFSEFFVKLDPAIQEDIVARIEHS
ncbi:MAG: glycine radical domain-containing protein, partial [Candidatus Zipacnadales bacterium]